MIDRHQQPVSPEQNSKRERAGIVPFARFRVQQELTPQLSAGIHLPHNAPAAQPAEVQRVQLTPDLKSFVHHSSQRVDLADPEFKDAKRGRFDPIMPESTLTEPTVPRKAPHELPAMSQTEAQALAARTELLKIYEEEDYMAPGYLDEAAEAVAAPRKDEFDLSA